MSPRCKSPILEDRGPLAQCSASTQPSNTQTAFPSHQSGGSSGISTTRLLPPVLAGHLAASFHSSTQSNMRRVPRPSSTPSPPSVNSRVAFWYTMSKDAGTLTMPANRRREFLSFRPRGAYPLAGAWKFAILWIFSKGIPSTMSARAASSITCAGCPAVGKTLNAPSKSLGRLAVRRGREGRPRTPVAPSAWTRESIARPTTSSVKATMSTKS